MSGNEPPAQVLSAPAPPAPGSLRPAALWLKAALAAAFLAYVLNCLAGTTADPDLWGFLAFGRLFWHSPGFPYQDVFSFTPTRNPWIYHEWLSGVLFYPLYTAFGAPGLQTLKYLLGLATVGLLYATARLRGAHPLAVLVTFLPLLPQFRGFYNPLRPQVFTFFFLALFLFVLERARLTGRFRPLFLFPLVMVAWANLHGGFLAGLGVLLLYGLGEALSRRPVWPYFLSLALSTLATLLNPYGLAYWKFMAFAATMPRPMITEWMSLFASASYIKNEYSLFSALAYPVYIFLLLGFFIFLSWRSRWFELTPVMVLAVGLVLAVRHMRHFIFLFIFLAVYLPVTLRPYVADLSSRAGLREFLHRPPVRWGVVSVLAGVLLALAVNLGHRAPLGMVLPEFPRSGEKPPLMYYPLNTFAFLDREGLSGRLLVEFVWGEYALWRFHPRLKVALDGRFETVYPREVIDDYFTFIFALPGWERFLEKYQPDFILIKDRGRLPELLRARGWRVLYSEPGAVLFARDQEIPEKYIRE